MPSHKQAKPQHLSSEEENQGKQHPEWLATELADVPKRQGGGDRKEKQESAHLPTCHP